eukprot:545444-Pelagomonas_calceolata.AAC.1
MQLVDLDEQHVVWWLPQVTHVHPCSLVHTLLRLFLELLERENVDCCRYAQLSELQWRQAAGFFSKTKKSSGCFESLKERRVCVLPGLKGPRQGHWERRSGKRTASRLNTDTLSVFKLLSFPRTCGCSLNISGPVFVACLRGEQVRSRFIQSNLSDLFQCITSHICLHTHTQHPPIALLFERCVLTASLPMAAMMHTLGLATLCCDAWRFSPPFLTFWSAGVSPALLPSCHPGLPVRMPGSAPHIILPQCARGGTCVGGWGRGSQARGGKLGAGAEQAGWVADGADHGVWSEVLGVVALRAKQ